MVTAKEFMENNEMLKYELDNLKKGISEIYSESMGEESNVSKAELGKMFDDIQSAIVGNGALPSNLSSRFGEEIKEQVEQLMKESLSASRNEEERVTNSNAEYMFSEDDFEIKSRENIDKFKEDGGIHKSNYYGNKVQEIMEKVDGIYEKQLMSLNSREGENAYYDVKGIVSGKTEKFMSIHEDFSENIRNEVFGKLDELGINLSEAERAQVEKQVEEHVEESPMMKSLRENTKSEEQVAREDADKLAKTDNERDFKDYPQFSQKEAKESREDNAALFK